MDILLSTVAGLGLRLLLDGLQEPFGAVLLGLWEGAAVHLLANPSSPDHYLAYALRVAVDLYFTANLQRAFIVLLWTTLGVLASETVHPWPPKRSRRRRTSRSVPVHIQPPIRAQPNTSTPAIRPSRPPTPPSFFLEGESEASPIPRYLPSAFPEGEPDSSESPPPKPVLLPTPPSTLISDARDLRSTRDSDHRLSTIEEQSSADEGSRPDYLGVPGAHRGFTTHTLASYAPSAVTTVPPLPVPNSTIRYIQTSVSRASPAAELALEDIEDMYAPSAPPLPVPNAGTTYLRSEYRPGTPSDHGDPLQTPQTAAKGELTDHDDGLTTPPGQSKELSPLVLEQNLFPTFGQVIAPELSSTQPVQEAFVVTNTVSTSTTAAASIAVAAAGSSGAQGQAAPLAVEYPSPSVAPDAPPDPDPDLAAMKPEPEPEPEPESSYPTPIASPSSDQQQQHQDDQHSEAETETDAASVISALPARLMYTRAEVLRAQARAAEAQRQKLMTLMNEAASDARFKDVLFLKEDIRVEEMKATKLHERAARRFYEARNASQKPQTVDVHGLRPAEAIRMTEKTLRDALTYGYPFVRVIVGKGLHSANGVPVLKETLMKTMHGHRIPCRVDPNNSGVLILTLPSS